ncbi:MAG: DedA family protein [Gemmatimonadetes bacterium]|nr:DedA family protein [Gemmatimonadota bacterium]
MEQWIEQFGPWAVFAGLMIEGEMALLLAGYAVHHGYLPLLPTLLLGTAGGICSDGLYYWLGRTYGARFLRSRPGLRPLRARAILLLRRRGHLMALGVRFAMGLRIVLPTVMGAARMPPRVYHSYNAVGAFLFAAVYLALGYVFGRAIQRVIGSLGLSEVHVFGAVIVIGAIAWLVREWRLYHDLPADLRTGWRPFRRRG